MCHPCVQANDARTSYLRVSISRKIAADFWRAVPAKDRAPLLLQQALTYDPRDPSCTSRGCTLDGYKILELLKGRRSIILGVWAAPGAPETLPKGGGLRPPPFARVPGAPGAPRAAQTPNVTDFRS